MLDVTPPHLPDAQVRKAVRMSTFPTVGGHAYGHRLGELPGWCRWLISLRCQMPSNRRGVPVRPPRAVERNAASRPAAVPPLPAGLAGGYWCRLRVEGLVDRGSPSTCPLRPGGR